MLLDFQIQFSDDELRCEVFRTLDQRDLNAYFFTEVDDMNFFLREIRTEKKIQVSAILLHTDDHTTDNEYSSNMW